MTKRRKPDSRIDEEMLREEMLREEEIQSKIESILEEEDEDVREEMILGLDDEELEAFNEAMDEIEEELYEECDEDEEDEEDECLNEGICVDSKHRIYEKPEGIVDYHKDNFHAIPWKSLLNYMSVITTRKDSGHKCEIPMGHDFHYQASFRDLKGNDIVQNRIGNTYTSGKNDYRLVYNAINEVCNPMCFDLSRYESTMPKVDGWELELEEVDDTTGVSRLLLSVKSILNGNVWDVEVLCPDSKSIFNKIQKEIKNRVRRK